MEQITPWEVEFMKKLVAYYCGDCEERFHIERVLDPNLVYCPYCGSNEDIAINSEDYKRIPRR